MNTKKFLKIIGIVLGILLVIVLLNFIFIHFDGFLSKKNPMSREEIVKLLEMGKGYQNYYYSPSENGTCGMYKTEYYYKDGISKCVVNGVVDTWKNSRTREKIQIVIDQKGNKIAYISSMDDENNNVNQDSQNGFDYSLISQEKTFNTNFEYLGEMKTGKRTTIIVKVWNKNSFIGDCTKFYIDKATGLVTKRVDYYMLGLRKMESNRNLDIGIVSDKDIEKPNLEGYKINDTFNK